MSPQYCRAFVIASMLFPDFLNVSPNYELYPFFPKIGFVVVVAFILLPAVIILASVAVVAGYPCLTDLYFKWNPK